MLVSVSVRARTKSRIFGLIFVSTVFESVINLNRTKERMVAIKQIPENNISQPLIGEDYQCCGESP